MAHPADACFGDVFEQQAVSGSGEFHMAVFLGGRLRNGAAQHVSHELCAVADAQHRNAQIQNVGGVMGRALQIDAVRATGEDNAFIASFRNLGKGSGIGQNFTVDMVVADAAGNQLVVLAAKVKY